MSGHDAEQHDDGQNARAAFSLQELVNAKPGGDRAGHELADLLGIKPRNMLTQLAEWARLGLLTKTGPGRYALPSPADAPGP